MTNERREYLSALLHLRNGKTEYLDLEALHYDAVHAGRLLELALERIGEQTTGMPHGMRGMTDEEYETILYAARSLQDAVELTELGWRLATEAAQKKAA